MLATILGFSFFCKNVGTGVVSPASAAIAVNITVLNVPLIPKYIAHTSNIARQIIAVITTELGFISYLPSLLLYH